MLGGWSGKGGRVRNPEKEEAQPCILKIWAEETWELGTLRIKDEGVGHQVLLTKAESQNKSSNKVAKLGKSFKNRTRLSSFDVPHGFYCRSAKELWSILAEWSEWQLYRIHAGLDYVQISNVSSQRPSRPQVSKWAFLLIQFQSFLDLLFTKDDQIRSSSIHIFY